MIRSLVILCSLWLIWLIYILKLKSSKIRQQKLVNLTVEIKKEPTSTIKAHGNNYVISLRVVVVPAHLPTLFFFFFSILCILSPVKNGSLHEFTLQGYWQNVRGENQNISKSLYSLDTVNCVFMEENLCDIVWERLCQMWELCPCSEVDAWSTPIYFFLPLIFIVLSSAASDRSNKSAFKSRSRLNYKMFKTL